MPDSAPKHHCLFEEPYRGSSAACELWRVDLEDLSSFWRSQWKTGLHAFYHLSKTSGLFCGLNDADSPWRELQFVESCCWLLNFALHRRHLSKTFSLFNQTRSHEKFLFLLFFTPTLLHFSRLSVSFFFTSHINIKKGDDTNFPSLII